jgi:hypothetical protein
MKKINNQGFATYMIVSLLLAMSLVMLFGIFEVKTLYLSEANRMLDGRKTNNSLRSCEEAALLTIKNDAAYTGAQNLNVGQNSCNFTIENGSGVVQKVIRSSSAINDSSQTSTIEINNLSGQIQIKSFSE